MVLCMPRSYKPVSPFRFFNSSLDVICLVVLMYVRFLLSLQYAEDLLFERGIDTCHEMIRLGWNRFGLMFAAKNRQKWVSHMGGHRYSRWHLNEV